jgi:putative transposase
VAAGFERYRFGPSLSGVRTRERKLEGLTDRSRRPYRHANQLPIQIGKLIVQLKQERPSWGAPKIRERLRRLHSDVQLPGQSGLDAYTAAKGGANLMEAIKHGYGR